MAVTSSQGDEKGGVSTRGCFITLEGGEGTGKSTQIQRLVARLAAHGIETVATREPGGSPRAEKLREIILSGFVEPFGPVAETLAFSAARIDHIDKTIRPALDEGCFVVCDRFMDSTRAYQGALGDVDPQFIAQLEEIVVGHTRPDLTIVLDLPPKIGLERAGARRGDNDADRFEAEDIEFHEEVRKAFLAIANGEPDRCARIHAGKSADEVEADIWQVVKERLLDRRPANAQARNETQPQTNLQPQPQMPARMPKAPNLRVVSDSAASAKNTADSKNAEDTVSPRKQGGADGGKKPESA